MVTPLAAGEVGAEAETSAQSTVLDAQTGRWLHEWSSTARLGELNESRAAPTVPRDLKPVSRRTDPLSVPLYSVSLPLVHATGERLVVLKVRSNALKTGDISAAGGFTRQLPAPIELTLLAGSFDISHWCSSADPGEKAWAMLAVTETDFGEAVAVTVSRQPWGRA
jgi:hypothetical protein